MKGLETKGDEERDEWVSDEHKADRAADFMDSIIRACCLCSSSLSMSSRHRRSLHGKGQRWEGRGEGRELRVA